MRVLVVHNRYQQKGGEDVVFEREVSLLRERGNEVLTHDVSNSEIDGFLSRLRVAIGTPFSFASYLRVRRLLRAQLPDVVHVHNFFPQISPSVFVACRHAGVPVVFTAHNFRTICPTATLYFKGQITERSVRSGPGWCVPARVYRGSLAGSLVLALMVALCRRPQFWRRNVQRILVLTEFSRQMFVSAGFPAELLVVKPNHVSVPADAPPGPPDSRQFIFVGRLVEEKGVAILAQAVSRSRREFKVVVAGDGPLGSLLASDARIEMRGFTSEVPNLIASSTALVFPSVWYEGLPMVILEAFAAGRPVIASRLGAMEALIEHGVTGLLFEAGSPEDLARTIEWALDHPEEMKAMGQRAKAKAAADFHREQDYERLMNIYADVVDAAGRLQ